MDQEFNVSEVDDKVVLVIKKEDLVRLMGLEIDEFEEDYNSNLNDLLSDMLSR